MTAPEQRAGERGTRRGTSWSGAWGLGPLQDLIDLPGVTDVLVNGGESTPHGHRAWIDRGSGLEPMVLPVHGETEVRALAVRLASAAGRRLDESQPWVDARLPGGIRLHAVVPPVTPSGTHLSLRLLRGIRPDLDTLVAEGGVPAAWVPLLRALISRRAAFLVTGGTGVGKTTLLSALLGVVPAGERIVLVEDIGELRPAHPHVVHLEARHANVEGRGEVTLDDLVRQALRMRPDRLVVGECRGPEVRELLAALNTGHSGGCGTVHANTPAELPARLEALGSVAGMSPAAVGRQAAAAFDAVLHLERGPAGRRLTQLAIVTKGPAAAASPPGLEVVPAVVADEDRTAPGRRGPGWSTLARLLGPLPPPWT